MSMGDGSGRVNRWIGGRRVGRKVQFGNGAVLARTCLLQGLGYLWLIAGRKRVDCCLNKTLFFPNC